MNIKKSSFLQGVKFCLILPRFSESKLVWLPVINKYINKVPPLSLCTVAAVLEQYGARVKIIDARALNLSLDAVIAEAAAFGPDFLGFTIMTYGFGTTMKWIYGIRRQINVPVLVGGAHVRAYPEEMLSHKVIDYGVIGDAEESLPELLYAIIAKKDMSEINGIVYRNENGQIKVNNSSLYFQNLDEAPLPARHLINNSIYQVYYSQYRNFTYMNTSRGCIFRCAFCEFNSKPYRQMSAKRVVDEMEICKKEFGINEIDIVDGLFAPQKEKIFQVCNEIIKRKLKIFWSFRARVTLIDKEVLAILKTAGCRNIHFGIESGDPRILRLIQKDISLERVRYAVNLTKKAGIQVLGYFIVGYYGENKETVKKTKSLICSLPLDRLQIVSISYFPNTKLYGKLVKEMKEDYWKKHTLNPRYVKEVPIIGTPFTRKELERMTRIMHLHFLLHKKISLKRMMPFNKESDFNSSIRWIIHLIRQMLPSLYRKTRSDRQMS